MATSETVTDQRTKAYPGKEVPNRTDCALAALRNLSMALQSTLQVEAVLEDLIRSATGIVRAEGGIAALCAPDGVSGFRHLLTEAKRAEASLRQSQAEVTQLLAQLQKDAQQLEARVAERTSQLEEINAELDSFAHSVSHDLRAPLRAMQGFAGILVEDGTLQETERIEYLTRILGTAQGMERLIRDLLDYSRLSRQEIMLQTVSLDQVVREAARQLELVCGGKRYRLEMAAGMPEVVGHQAVLVQVLLNLMTNGIKFVPAGVTPSLRVWTEQSGGRCRLLVADNGIGIPAGQQERIFKIFERLHSQDSYPGTGVGLAIVRKAVTRLGGRVGVDSREGSGSRFWIELPLAAEGGERRASNGGKRHGHEDPDR